MEPDNFYGVGYPHMLEDIASGTYEDYSLYNVVEDLTKIFSSTRIDETRIPYLVFKGLVEFGSFDDFRAVRKHARELNAIKEGLRTLEGGFNQYLKEKSGTLNRIQHMIDFLISDLGAKNSDLNQDMSFMLNNYIHKISCDSVNRLRSSSDLRVDFQFKKGSSLEKMAKSPFFILRCRMIALPEVILGATFQDENYSGLHERYDHLRQTMPYYKIFESKTKRAERENNIRLIDYHISRYKSELVGAVVHIRSEFDRHSTEMMHFRSNYNYMKGLYKNWKKNSRSDKGYLRVQKKGALLHDMFKDIPKEMLDIPFDIVDGLITGLLTMDIEEQIQSLRYMNSYKNPKDVFAFWDRIGQELSRESR